MPVVNDRVAKVEPVATPPTEEQVSRGPASADGQPPNAGRTPVTKVAVPDRGAWDEPERADRK